ncbi:hypothetical protein JI435_143190, partial [Parastagonospora nodorum SN15]
QAARTFIDLMIGSTHRLWLTQQLSLQQTPQKCALHTLSRRERRRCPGTNMDPVGCHCGFASCEMDQPIDAEGGRALFSFVGWCDLKVYAKLWRVECHMVHMVSGRGYPGTGII